VLQRALRVQRVALGVVEGHRGLLRSHVAILSWRLIRQKGVLAALRTHIRDLVLVHIMMGVTWPHRHRPRIEAPILREIVSLPVLRDRVVALVHRPIAVEP